MAGAKERLSFFSNQIDRLKVEKQFRRDVYAFSGHFHGIVHYKFVPEGDIEDVMLLYRGLSDSPPFAECAVAADSFLARFDSQWTNSPERRILLERWRDSPDLDDYPRDSLQKAYVQVIAERERKETVVEADSTTEDTESIAPSGNYRPTGSSRLARIAGAAMIFVFALALAFRGRHRQNRHH